MRRKPNHDELDRLNTAEEDIRKLKLAGFPPTSAAIYDGYLATDTNPGFINFRRDDIFINGSGEATIRLTPGDDVPPLYNGSDRPFAPYVWHDSGGYVAAPNSFTAVMDGVYEVQAYMIFDLNFGFLRDAGLGAFFDPGGGATVTICADQVVGPLDATDPDLATLVLNATGQALMSAGDTLNFQFFANLRGLGGMVSNSVILQVPRTIHNNPPPDEHVGGGSFVGPVDSARFSITKIADG